MAVQQTVRSVWPRCIRSPGLREVLLLALGVRLVFMALTADTYDYDEFVLLFLAREWARGLTPYHDFLFFHPPGILVLLRGIEAFTNLWWPTARLLTAVLDAGTAGLVWGIGRILYDSRTAIAAGVIYGLSPLALVSSTHISQDPVLTALGVLGLLLLLRHPGWKSGLAAGACLGLAIWVKYPAAYFAPIYLLAAPRRAAAVLGSACAVVLGGLVGVHGELSAFYQQTVTFQRTRWLMDESQRWQTAALYWLAVNPLAPVATVLLRGPAWLLAGFWLGGLFALPSQVYFHYFVPVVPFGALLAAPLVTRLAAQWLASLAGAGLLVALIWGLVLGRSGDSTLFVTSAHLSSLNATVTYLRAHTRPGESILADRDEYPYLADRPSLAHYFWNVGVLVDTHYLVRRLGRADAAVLSYGASSGYPAGTVAYLDAHFPRVDMGSASVWRLDARQAPR